MREHSAQCISCAQQDLRIRRSLFVAWNARVIEPSSGFQARLHRRLAVLTLYSADASVGDARAQGRTGTRDIRPRVSLSR
jgi:hypothetical protein